MRSSEEAAQGTHAEAERRLVDRLLSGEATQEENRMAVRLLLRRSRERKEEGVVIPFRAARSGLWAAQRDWMEAGPLRRLADRVAEELERAERDLEAVEAALHGPRGEGR